MIKINLEDTIAAIATPIGESGIGVIRISGKGALKVADKIFQASDKLAPSKFKTHTVHHGWIVGSYESSLLSRARKDTNAIHNTHQSTRNIIDEVLLTVFRAPNSYTGEDCVEISCHGSIVALRAALDLILENGCRLALPGEFTKRAFLNGKIDLSQAEAVLDIIKAKTDAALKIGIQQLKGDLSSKINRVREIILNILSILETSIDFPEEEIEEASFKEIRDKLFQVHKTITDLLAAAHQGRILREGINAVICGKPNVGKSSLLNALLRQERSIVTPIAGTTRDTVEETIDIKGIPIRIVDTAGIIEPKDLIEKKAMQRSRKYVAAADLVILVFDGSKRLSKDDEILIRKLKPRNTIAVINKIDLTQRIENAKLQRVFNKTIDISAKKSKYIDRLEEAIAAKTFNGKASSSEIPWVSNLRHIRALKNTQKLIAEALNSLDNKLSSEFLAQGLRDALAYLDDILGKRFSDDLLDKIFSEFCIGK